tara:strand:- start:147 stop:770 length:624 start_codon:yes stop_codon:yes gene_type:complete
MKRLNEIYPEVPIPLQHKNTFELLISVLLSAQCTDKRVNEVTPTLFVRANTPNKMLNLTVQEIYNIVRPCGLGPKKSKCIFELSRILVDKFGSKVPKTLIELESLPGVGHKTASVVLSQGFGYATFPIDTHIHRLAQRWGLTNGHSVKQTEKDLKTIFPKNAWNKLHLQIIFYGREFCTARGCDGRRCEICLKCFPNRKLPVKTKKA